MAEVQARKAELESKNGSIFVISFGSLEKARKWKLDTGCELRIMVDPDRRLYCAVGLRKSMYRVWGIGSLIFYAEQMCAGKALVKGEDDDDLHQMGGDFIIDCQGKMGLVYCSKVSTDRPSVDQLVAVLKSLSKL